jgi:hypothetical protein
VTTRPSLPIGACLGLLLQGKSGCADFAVRRTERDAVCGGFLFGVACPAMRVSELLDQVLGPDRPFGHALV